MIHPVCTHDVPLIPTMTTEPRFDVITYPDRIDEILALRQIANCAADQLAPDTSTAELFDARDLEASHVVAEMDDQIVGTVRLASPLEGFLLNSANPCVEPVSGLPNSSEYLETAWAAIHPNYQGRGLLWHLAAHLVVTAKQRGKPFIVGAANPGMWRFWQRCGYRKMDVPYFGRSGRAPEFSLIISDVDAAITGRDIAPPLAQALKGLLDGPG